MPDGPGGSTSLIEEARYWERRRRIVQLGVVAAVVVAIGAGIGIGAGVFGNGSATPPPSSSAGVTQAMSAAGIFRYVIDENRSDTIISLSSRHQTAIESPMVIDLATGRQHPVGGAATYWYDPLRQLLYVQPVIDGQLEPQSAEPVVSIGATSLQAALDELATSGVARVVASGIGDRAGSGIFKGRAVEWVRFASGGPAESLEVAADTTTGEPVAYHEVCSACRVSWPIVPILDAGHIARVPAGFSPTARPARPFAFDSRASSRSYDTSLTLAGAASALVHRPLFAGRSVGGLKLTSETLMHTTTRLEPTNTALHSRSVEFIYGTESLNNETLNSESLNKAVARLRDRTDVSTSRVVSEAERLVALRNRGRLGPRFTGVTITETATITPGGQFLKAGSAVEVSVLGGPGLDGAPLPPQGQALIGIPTALGSTVALQKDGLYMLITASSRALAVDVARTLQPVP